MKVGRYFLFSIASPAVYQSFPSGEQLNVSIPNIEYQALSDLYVATNGTYWHWQDTATAGAIWDFSSNIDPCSPLWQGLVCSMMSDDGYQHIQNVSLPQYNLQGSIPQSISNFEYLEELNLYANHLTGAVPDAFNTTHHLQYIDLSFNILSGVFPESLCLCTQLSTLIFTYNHLNGTIPDSITQLTRLLELYLDSNSFIGSIPSGIGELTRLTAFHITGNKLTNTIPQSIGQLTELTTLSLGNNHLNGSIPSTIGFLTKLTYFDIMSNHLSKSIPDEITQLTKLGTIQLNANQLTGTIPKDINKLAELTKLLLSDNQLKGTLPESLYDVVTLTDLQLQANSFTGTISANIGQLTSLLLLIFSDNLLNGTLPMEIGTMKVLSSFDVSSNHLTGTIPSTISNLTWLGYIDISSNYFHGTIPNNISTACFSLISLNFYYNELTGPMPNNFVSGQGYTNVVAFNNNYLSGSISNSICNMPKLQYIELQHNLFSSSIPTCIFNHLGARFLYLQNNLLSGSIPVTSNTTANKLNIIDLSSNLLSGTIPQSVSQLTKVETLFINNNRLTGNLDTTFDATMQLKLINVDVSDNQLTGSLPSEVFKIPGIQAFAAVSNCFSGSLPQQICSAPSLLTLALDGLVSGSNCKQHFFNKRTGIESYYLKNNIEGGVPECLFSLPKLKILHLSGNGLTGSIPDSIISNSALVDLSLSNNNLKGVIPSSLQYRHWTNFDLSFNKLTGTLRTAFPAYNLSDSLCLQVNRLSGKIPHSLKNILNIAVLDGNIFTCDSTHSTLPVYDADKNDYECGSNSFNYAMYGWLCFVILILCVAAYCHYIAGFRVWSDCQQWLSVFHSSHGSSHHRNVELFGQFVTKFRRLCLFITVFVFIVVLPVNNALTNAYHTYTFAYAWTLSSAYISGVVPAVVVLLLLVLLCVCSLYFILRSPAKAPTAAAPQSTTEVRWTASQCVTMLCVIVVDILLMIGLNVGYVFINTSYSSNIVQITRIAVAALKVVWNNFAVRGILRLSKKFHLQNHSRQLNRDNEALLDTKQPTSMSREAKSHHIGVAVFVMLFNNLAAPFIAVAFVSSDCFYNVITTPPEVVVSYLYASCFVYAGDTCTFYKYGTDLRGTSYIPPYTYSYQCSSTFVTTYAAIYVFMYIMIAFIAPMMQLALKTVHSYTSQSSAVHKIIDKLLPNILKSSAVQHHTDQIATATEECDASMRQSTWKSSVMPSVLNVAFSNKLFDCDVFIVSLINMFAVLITFGVIFPPVALVGCVAIYSTSFVSQLCIGRYLFTMNNNLYAGLSELSIKELDHNCAHAQSMFMNAIWITIPFTVVFYSYLLFDMMGDAVGWERATSMPVAVLILILLAVLVQACCGSHITSWFSNATNYKERRGSLTKTKRNSTTGQEECEAINSNTLLNSLLMQSDEDDTVESHL